MLTEFRDFIMRGNVVDLAVAVVLGAAFGAVVTGLVASFVTPQPMNALMARLKRGEEPEAEAPPQDVVLLMEIRDLLRERRAG